MSDTVVKRGETRTVVVKPGRLNTHYAALLEGGRIEPADEKRRPRTVGEKEV